MSGDSRGGGSCGMELGDFCFQLADGFFVHCRPGDYCFSQVLSHFVKSFDRSIGAKHVKNVEG